MCLLSGRGAGASGPSAPFPSSKPILVCLVIRGHTSREAGHEIAQVVWQVSLNGTHNFRVPLEHAVFEPEVAHRPVGEDAVLDDCVMTNGDIRMAGVQAQAGDQVVDSCNAPFEHLHKGRAVEHQQPGDAVQGIVDARRSEDCVNLVGSDARPRPAGVREGL